MALGSSLSTVFLPKGTSLAQGVVGSGILVPKQFIVTWFNIRSRTVLKATKAENALLFYKGRLQEEIMECERVPVSEILAALRSRGIANIEEVGAVILETGGTLAC